MSERLTGRHAQRWQRAVALSRQGTQPVIGIGTACVLSVDKELTALRAEVERLRSEYEDSLLDARVAWLRVEEACHVIERIEENVKPARDGDDSPCVKCTTKIGAACVSDPMDCGKFFRWVAGYWPGDAGGTGR